jgi:hypothetical protein
VGQPRRGSELSLAKTYRRVAIDHKGRGGMKGASIVSVDPLRQRDDFQKLVAELEGKGK